MIINIPINVDEELLNERVRTDYDLKITNEIIKRIEKALTSAAKTKYYSARAEDGIIVLVEEQLDSFIKEYKDEIIERAADKLAERLARTKKAKEVING